MSMQGQGEREGGTRVCACRACVWRVGSWGGYRCRPALAEAHHMVQARPPGMRCAACRYTRAHNVHMHTRCTHSGASTHSREQRVDDLIRELRLVHLQRH